MNGGAVGINVWKQREHCPQERRLLESWGRGEDSDALKISVNRHVPIICHSIAVTRYIPEMSSRYFPSVCYGAMYTIKIQVNVGPNRSDIVMVPQIVPYLIRMGAHDVINDQLSLDRTTQMRSL